MPATGILAVAVWRIIAQKLPCLHLPAKDGTNIFRKLLGIPFIDQAVDLTGFFVGMRSSIHPIHHRHKANPPEGKQRMQIFFRRACVSGKARLRFA